MPNDTPLADPRLEAAAHILHAWHGLEHKNYLNAARMATESHSVDALAMLSTAIRETHADKLAEALDGLLGCEDDLPGWSHPQFALARAALAAYKELANG